jgi:hypothetical protein
VALAQNMFDVLEPAAGGGRGDKGRRRGG